MKRTQLYLHEDIWKVLHIRSRQQRTSISDLVRQAVREKYGSSPGGPQRGQCRRSWVCVKTVKDLPDSTAYVRRLRKGKRLRRIAR